MELCVCSYSHTRSLLRVLSQNPCCTCSFLFTLTLLLSCRPRCSLLLLSPSPSPPLPAAAAVLSVRLLLQLFILRKFIEYELSEIGLGSDEVYFCSLSSATVVYKGQLTPEQVRGVWGLGV